MARTRRLGYHAVPFVLAVIVAAPLGVLHAPLWAAALVVPPLVVFGLWWTFIRSDALSEDRR